MKLHMIWWIEITTTTASHITIVLITTTIKGIDWEEKLVPYLTEGGATSVAVVGTCFGSYTGVHIHASSFGQGFMKGGIYFHPGHPELMDFLAEDEVGAYMKITTPQAFGDTPDSSPNVRPGGIASQIIETEYE